MFDDIQKRNHIIALFDVYGGLLTPKQHQIFHNYYNEDFSLAEIAEQIGISRQAVHNALQRTEELMNHYEKEIGLFDYQKQISDLLDDMIGQLSLSLETSEWPEKEYMDLLRRCKEERG